MRLVVPVAMTVALTAAAFAFTPPDPSVRIGRRSAAETELSVKISPPDASYDVVVTPKEAAAKGERAYWFITPRKGVKTVDRDGVHWHMKVPAGTYEVSYTTFINGEQVDSFIEFTTGDAPPPPPGPTDPLQPLVNAAYKDDQPADPRARMLAGQIYASYYRKAAATINAYDGNNEDAMWLAVQGVENASGINLQHLIGVRAILKAEITKLRPRPANDVEHPVLTPTVKQSIADCFTRFANLLEGAMK